MLQDNAIMNYGSIGILQTFIPHILQYYEFCSALAKQDKLTPSVKDSLIELLLHYQHNPLYQKKLRPGLAGGTQPKTTFLKLLSYEKKFG